MTNKRDPMKIKLQKMYSLPYEVVLEIEKKSKYYSISKSSYIARLVYKDMKHGDD